RARTAATLDQLVQQITQAARPGDHIVCMSNGAFGGVHERLLQALAAGSPEALE
ncbi:MAG: UDP-N-acetylmuramate:L-alanyl-gamma-D-glutamyl-meso-diaminopimelate ligase, partial [Giesbergeria sp.]|nr:UDP-N-acetylmuramate:L-alanyl-gamma-D-glutamyl-meso-diaminopimelate ligase [Giesbergeria sp.]